MHNLYSNQPVLERIAAIISPQIELLVDQLGINYRNSDRYLIGKCPAHNGSNPTSWRMYLGNDEYDYCKWVCFSNRCHKTHGASPFGLVKGVRDCGWRQAIDYIIDLYNIDTKNIKVDKEKIEQHKANKRLAVFNKRNVQGKGYITRQQVRDKLVIPAQFYLNKGYSKEILDQYDIGVCTNKQKLMRYRAVVPIYDNQHQYLLGCTGRTVLDDFHTKGVSKWLHSPSFNPKNCLFNWWQCQEAQNIIIVESVGNALKLIQEGQKNVIAIFGTALTDAQQILLECSQVNNVYLAMDPGEAGERASNFIKKQLGKLFNVHVLDVHYNNFEDIGDMDSLTIQDNIKRWKI
jgi:5S rRNA maturation endonuclease (ribonuclease M5)